MNLIPLTSPLRRSHLLEQVHEHVLGLKNLEQLNLPHSNTHNHYKKNIKNHTSSPYRLHITVPKVRSLCGKIFAANNPELHLQAWHDIYHHSPYFEVMSLAIYHFQHRSLSVKEGLCLLTWIERCCLWEHSDDLSKIYAQLIEDHPKQFYPHLKAWNKDPSLWKRRQSLVSLIEYARKRKRVLPFHKMRIMIDGCLDDKEYYVQKGLGWTLREMYNLYKQETLDYIQKHLHVISPIAYSAATEKLPAKLRASFREQRKQHRKTSSATS